MLLWVSLTFFEMNQSLLVNTINLAQGIISIAVLFSVIFIDKFYSSCNSLAQISK